MPRSYLRVTERARRCGTQGWKGAEDEVIDGGVGVADRCAAPTCPTSSGKEYRGAKREAWDVAGPGRIARRSLKRSIMAA